MIIGYFPPFPSTIRMTITIDELRQKAGVKYFLSLLKEGKCIPGLLFSYFPIDSQSRPPFEKETLMSTKTPF